MSNLTAIELIPNNSFATTGLFNQRFSTISANFAALNSDLTIDFPSGETLSVFSNIDASGNVHAGGQVGIGATPSAVTTAVLTVAADSSKSDYIHFEDPSGGKSNYLIGSRVGGTADGLNLYDLSGDTMIVSFSKQSVRFYQQVAAPVVDTGGAVFNVKSFGAKGDGSTDDTAAVQLTIDTASAASRPGKVYFPGGIYNMTVLSIATPLVLEGAGASASILQSTSSATFITFNYVSTDVGIDGFRWGPGLRDLALWREGLPMTGTALEIGGANGGARGFYASNIRTVGFGLTMSLTTKFILAGFNHCMFDASRRHITINPSASDAGENIAFINCTFANGQNATNNILWNNAGFNGNFVGCSFDAFQLSLAAGTVNCVNCHFENIGTNGQQSIISVAGGFLNVYGGELYVQSSTFTQRAPFAQTGGISNVYGIVAHSGTVSNVSAVYDITGGTLREMGTRQLGSNILSLLTGTGGSVTLWANEFSRNSVIATTDFRGTINLSGSTAVRRVGDNLRVNQLAEGAAIQFNNASDGSNLLIINDATGTVQTGFQIQVPDGSATYPEYAFSSESSLGWYRSGASTIRQSHGSIVLAPNFGDRVGVGVAAPQEVVDIRGSGTGRNGVQIYNTVAGTGNSAKLEIGADGAAGALFLEVFSSTFAGNPNQAWVYSTAANAPLVLGSAGAARITIRSGGTVEVSPVMYFNSGISVGVGGTIIPAMSSTSSRVAAFVVQPSASSFTVITWAAVKANDQILTTIFSDGAVSSLSSGIVLHSHATQNGQFEMRLSNVSTLVQNQSQKTYYFTRITPF